MSKNAASSGKTADGGLPGAYGEQGTQELTGFVQNLLQNMQERFQEMSDTIITRIDEMGTRIDDLERSISELMQQAGMEEGEISTSKSQPAQSKKR
ncbi:hypothetical protein C3747_71g797c [Trypanosoma cruzi]|uniref:Heat shock factor binding protein 1 n=3 Tax=Trypanosoma cruzi TaxID=5693 RepID=Q4DF25_TRYCC|nr:hypothetical protein, conserved [Trypanosoma cruzi]ESS71198.1 hypothetical protein TCDM_13795 [Trypanosoma cruzi Dm28c]EAN91132.1 hypothetical protein, conserved [Trypanosoma cruzi]KAF8283790.1 Heat shock factor binding 1 domain-containing protein [Trypanosoma cruzi]PWV02390.1 hypothetical protein C4B63_2g4188c [Trypanosoma cruzi]PWV10163.1 hypothetical protein C3747_71g797c [Trypanosoma cruzi]|eukprot:XP_812983.1 hypothetical protein [Trypanosoma cruzi strain CL Brener]